MEKVREGDAEGRFSKIGTIDFEVCIFNLRFVRTDQFYSNKIKDLPISATDPCIFLPVLLFILQCFN